MTKILSALALAGVLVGSGLAYAESNEAARTVTDINPEAMIVSLDDGKAYPVAGGVDISNLEVGDKVTVDVVNKDGKEIITGIQSMGTM
jgi:uncharacterized protein DUF1344